VQIGNRTQIYKDRYHFQSTSVTSNQDFKVTNHDIIQHEINRKLYRIELYLQCGPAVSHVCLLNGALERPLHLTSNISETVQKTHIVAMEY